VRRLCDADVVWCDENAGSVLIDANMDAWFIGFRGGFGQGWVQREHAGTVDCDYLRLAKIIDHTLPPVNRGGGTI
jgi:hypothetical protein